MVKHWEKRGSRHVLDTPVFRLRVDECVSPRNGYEMPVYVLETRPWINVLPLTPENEVVMVRQYRFGSEEVTLEIPGGLVDEGESPDETVSRELREETGCEADRIILLGKVRPNPAIQNSTCHIYLATGVVETGGQNLDVGEDIRIERIPLHEVMEMIRQGAIDHSLVLNAFFLYEMWVKSKPENRGE